MKMPHASIAASVSAFALFAVGPVYAQQADSAATSDDADVSVQDVVIVTANRRAEAITDVPSSVTAIGEESLETLNAARFDDFVSQVPNINFTGRGPGQRQIILRGISTSTNEQSATVATYIDDVAVGSSTSLAVGARTRPDVNVFDLERIEVLRGPQGTLYGANSLGGLLKYVTKTPSTDGFEFQGRIEGLSVEEGGSGFAVNGAVNIPISDTLAFRASAFTREEPGYVDNVTLGQDDVNDLKNTGARFALQADLTPDLMVRGVVMIQQFETGGYAQVDISGSTGENLFGDFDQERFTPEPKTQDLNIYALTAEWDLGFAELLSTTSFSEVDEDSTVDFTQFDADFVNGFLCETDALGALAPECPAGPLSANVYTAFPADRTSNTARTTQELQLVSPSSGTFEWRIGGYYTQEDSLFVDNEVGLVSLSTPRSDGVLAFFSENDSTFEQLAVFGEATTYLGEDFDVTFGGRFSNNKIELTQSNASVFDVGVSTASDTSEDDAFTFLVTPRWHISDNTMVYFRAASGFRPGAPNIASPAALAAGAEASFDSDKLVNYEVGVKSATGDGKFSVEATAFFIDWSDIQIRANAGGFRYISNAGAAESQGAEFVFTANPFAGFKTSVNFGYTDATLTEDAPAIGGEAGMTLPNAPEWTVGGVASYGWTLTPAIDADVGASFRYVGDRLADFNRNGSDRLVMDGYTTVDLFGGLNFDNYSIDLFVRNVGNERGIETVDVGFFPATVTVSRPRTIGISLTAEY